MISRPVLMTNALVFAPDGTEALCDATELCSIASNESSDDNDVMSVEEKSNSNNATRNIPKKTKVRKLDLTDRKEKAPLKGIYSSIWLIRVIFSLLIRIRPRKERQTEKDN